MCRLVSPFSIHLNNFQGETISNFLHVWNNFTRDKWILSQVEGVRLDFCEDPSSIPDKKELSFSAHEEKLIEQEIQTLLRKGVICEAETESGQIFSNVFLRAGRRKTDLSG